MYFTHYLLLITETHFSLIIVSIIQSNVKRRSHGQNSINPLSGLFIDLLISLVHFNIIRLPKTKHEILDSDKTISVH